MQNQQQIYKQLRKQYIKDYEGHFKDEYEGQNKLNRNATAYALRNTLVVWKQQYKETK